MVRGANWERVRERDGFSLWTVVVLAQLHPWPQQQADFPFHSQADFPFHSHQKLEGTWLGMTHSHPLSLICLLIYIPSIVYFLTLFSLREGICHLLLLLLLLLHCLLCSWGWSAMALLSLSCEFFILFYFMIFMWCVFFFPLLRSCWTFEPVKCIGCGGWGQQPHLQWVLLHHWLTTTTIPCYYYNWEMMPASMGFFHYIGLETPGLSVWPCLVQKQPPAPPPVTDCCLLLWFHSDAAISSYLHPTVLTSNIIIDLWYFIFAWITRKTTNEMKDKKQHHQGKEDEAVGVAAATLLFSPLLHSHTSFYLVSHFF